MARRKRRRGFTCPNCGAAVRAGALACPECGSDESTGWSQDTLYDDLDLPEPGYGPERPASRRSSFPWKRAGLVLLLLFVLLLALRRI